MNRGGGAGGVIVGGIRREALMVIAREPRAVRRRRSLLGANCIYILDINVLMIIATFWNSELMLHV